MVLKMGIAGCESVLQNENIVLLGYSGVFLKKYMIAVIHIEPTKKTERTHQQKKRGLAVSLLCLLRASSFDFPVVSYRWEVCSFISSPQVWRSL